MNNQIINKFPRSAFKGKYERQSWLNFSSRITKNPFMLNFLAKRDGNKCGWCGGVMKANATIHHLSYDHFCASNEIIKVERPTEKRPDRQSKVPDCESCCNSDTRIFLLCAEKLALVHRICNKKIAEKSLEKTGY